MIRVYRFGLRPPTINAALVRQQLMAAHRYSNVHVEIERGRRAALRLCHDESPEVAEALAALKAAAKGDRLEKLKALSKARNEAETGRGVWRIDMKPNNEEPEWASTVYGHPIDFPSKADADEHLSKSAHLLSIIPPILNTTAWSVKFVPELDRINELAASLVRSARAIATKECYWGTYLLIEASADQARKTPLYQRDGLTPAYPRFWAWPGEGQVGVQIQGGIPTADAFRRNGSRLVNIRRQVHRYTAPSGKVYPPSRKYGWLQLRISTEDRQPVWAEWPIKLHREIPDNATWKRVNVSLRREGTREEWSTEITLDIPGDHPRFLDPTLKGAIAVELMWSPLDDGSIHVARWQDGYGECGNIFLPARIVQGIRKPDGIRSVRDILLNEMRAKFQKALVETKEPIPRWARGYASTVHLWRSPSRFHMLASRWREDRCDAGRGPEGPYTILAAWEERDAHLWDYEAGARREAVRERNQMYRLIALGWARKYKTVLVPDRDLSKEARFGEAADIRVTVNPEGFRGALRSTFGWNKPTEPGDAVDVEWMSPDSEDSWLSFALDGWRAGKFVGVARSGSEPKKGGAWARRKSKKSERVA